MCTKKYRHVDISSACLDMIPTIRLRGSCVLQEHILRRGDTPALDIIGLVHFFILLCLPLIFENLVFTTSHTNKMCPGIVQSRAATVHQSDENQWEFCIALVPN